MMIRRTLCLLFLLAMASADVGFAEGRSGLVPQTPLRRYGLKRAWYTHAELDRARERVAHVTVHVSRSDFVVVKEVQYDGGKISYSEQDLDQFGDMIGVDGAIKLAKRRQTYLKERGEENVEIVDHEIPAVTMYVQSDHGTLHAIDGESGRTLWTRIIGNPDHPTLKPGASDSYVALVNGSNLFVLNARDGSEAWSVRLGGAPGSGPAVSNFRVFAPLLNGKVEVYSLENPKKLPWVYQSAGNVMIQPIVATNTVGWVSNRGIFYSALHNRPVVRYRLHALDTIRAHPTFSESPEQWYVPSTDGYVYAVHERSGDVVWRFSAGGPVEQPPTVIGDVLYAVTDYAGMYQLGVVDGQERWWTELVRKVVAATDERVYCIDKAGQLLILDAKTGGRIGVIPLSNVDLVMTNWQTDRIYLGTQYGIIQCIHEEANKFPMIHHAGVSESAEDRPEIKQGDAAGKPDDDNPFGGPGTEDPFGGDADPFGGDDGGGAAPDPFGGDDGGGAAPDPFGGDDGGGAAPDPFGGDDGGGAAPDPFGGGGAAPNPFGD